MKREVMEGLARNERDGMKKRAANEDDMRQPQTPKRKRTK